MNLLDDEFQPHADQWRYLSSISRMPPAEVGDLTEEAGRRGRVLGVRLPAVEDEDEAPWLAPPSRRKPDTSITDPLPETVEVVLGDQVYVDRSGLPASLVNQLAPSGRGANTLVLVHRRQLLDQWVARLGSFLDLRPDEIGRIGGGKRKATGVIDVAVIQSLISWSTSVTTCRRSASRRWRAAARLGTSSACPRR